MNLCNKINQFVNNVSEIILNNNTFQMTVLLLVHLLTGI